MRLTLAVDESSYDVGEVVTVTAEATNTLDEPLEYGFTRPVDAQFALRVVTALAGRQSLNAPELPTVVPNMALAAGESVHAEAQWNQLVDTYETPIQAPEGRYVIEAELLVSAVGTNQPVTISAAVEFDLHGGSAVITQQEVIERVLRDEGVVDWFDAHNPAAVCAVANVNTFYMANSVTGDVSVVPSLVYDNQIDNDLPICSPVTSGDEWRVIFFAPEGPEPNRISAYLSLDGEFLRIEEEG